MTIPLTTEMQSPPVSGAQQSDGDGFAALDLFARLSPRRAERLREVLGASQDAFGRVLYQELDRLFRHEADLPGLLALLEAFDPLLSDAPQQSGAKLFWDAVVTDAKLRSIRRRRKGRIRSLWGVTPINMLQEMAEADRRLGNEAETVVFNAYDITSNFDVVLKPYEDAVVAQRPADLVAFHNLVLVWALLRFDNFHLFNDAGLALPLGGNGADFGMALREMDLYRAAGKQLYTYAYGADHRMRQKTLKSGRFDFCMECPEPGRFCVCDDLRFCVCDDLRAEKMLAEIAERATAMIGTSLSMAQLPGARNLYYPVVDTDRLRPVPAVEPAPSSSRPLRVGHFPNHGVFKGTKYIEEAVAGLSAEGVQIELDMISGVLRTEALARMAGVDVLVDQLVSGAFGLTAVEAMALGLPVVCYLRPGVALADLDNCPIVHADPDTIKGVLRRLAQEHDALAAIGVRSRDYVVRNYSIDTFAGRLALLYADTADLAPRDRERLRTIAAGGVAASHKAAQEIDERPRRQMSQSFAGRVVDTVRAAVSLREHIGARVRERLPMIDRLARHAFVWRQIPLKLSCIFSFAGLMPRLAGEVDPKLVVMVAYANLPHDPRIEREARALVEAGFKVVVVCPTLGDEGERALDWGPGVTFDIVDSRAARFVFRWPGFLGDVLFTALLKYRPFAIHAHDLNMAFIAFAAARRTGAKTVVDFHEWYSENVELENGVYIPLKPRWQNGYRWLERHSLAHADIVVTVCDSIADAMANELGNGRRPEVIRNIPRLSAEPTRSYLPLKEQLGLAPERFLLLYQGGIGPSRLLEPVIEALAFAERCTLLIRGPLMGQYEAAYREIAERAGAGDRLILQGPVPSRDVVAAAVGADAGLYSVAGICRSFTYALPNKVFEYMAAGLPAVVADYPEARRLVETHQIGLTFDPNDPRSIADAINRLIDDLALRRRLAGNTVAALQELDAEREWTKLSDLYLDLGAGSSQRSTSLAPTL